MPSAPDRQRRRAMLTWIAAGLTGQSRADPKANGPIQLYVGYPPGGGTDFVARLVAARLARALEQPVTVMNLPGATGAIALEKVVKSTPDGRTLAMISAADTILPALRANLPFDMGRDLAPVAPAALGALGLVVHPGLPVRSVADLIALAKAKPGVLNFASPGIGNSQHLAGEAFNRLAGVRMVHVPFKGGAEATNATISGEVQVAFASLAPALPFVQAGRLRLLAVTSRSRSAAVPDVPTIEEAGVPGYDVSTWFGIAAPAGTPRAVLQRINAAVARSMQAPDVRDTLLKQGLEPMAANTEQFAGFVQHELARNAALAREVGLKAE